MEGFFDGANVAFAPLAPSTAAHGVPTEALTPPSEPVPRKEGTHTERVSEITPISTKTPTPLEGVILAAVQTEAASPILPLVISTSDPFAVLSQAVKDGSSLVVTPSSFLALPHVVLMWTCPPRSLRTLEDLEDEPVLKKRISDFNEEESAPLMTEFMGMCFFFFFFLHMYLRCSLLRSPFYLYVCFLVCRDL